jgi:hypothetical protein
LKILRSKHVPFIDVFQGEGWENWSRYMKKRSELIFLKGIKLSNAKFAELTKTIYPPNAGVDAGNAKVVGTNPG